MSQTYSFPVLSDQELLPCLKEMELPLTSAQLAKPSYEIVKPVYENVVSSLMGISRSELAILWQWISRFACVERYGEGEMWLTYTLQS